MTNPSPPRWPVPDRRTPEQIDVDRAAVREQVRILATPDGSDPNAGTVLARISVRAARAGTPFDVVPQPAGPVLPRQNELVVEATDAQLRDAGLRGYSPIDRAGRRTRILRAEGKPVADLLADAKRLRGKKIKANINPMVPLGYVVKGDAFPGRTTGPGDFISTGVDPSVRVAIIDTGRVAQDRSDGWDTGVVKKEPDPLNVVEPLDRNDYFSGHGTFTAGIVRQISPRCEVVVYRFTGNDGLGTDTAAADALLRAAAEAGNRRLIINASFGAPAVDGVPPLALQEAVEQIAAEHPEVLIVASAGNDSTTEKLYPAGFGQFGVKAVGALNADLSGAEFSNRGGWVQCSTVGVGVVSTFVKGKLPPEPGLDAPDVTFPADAWATWSGTSFTAPQISGAVAHLCTQSPALTPKDAFDQLIAGRPTLDEYGAVVHLLPGTPLS
jgi:subtilisin family serine protease